MRANEFIKEGKLAKSSRAAAPKLRRHDSLDNSSPYSPWRFGVALAGMPDYPMDREGPTGQKLVTMSYSKADEEIVAATEKAMGATGVDVTSSGSHETDTVGTVSPVANWMKPTKEKKAKKK